MTPSTLTEFLTSISSKFKQRHKTFLHNHRSQHIPVVIQSTLFFVVRSFGVLEAGQNAPVLDWSRKGNCVSGAHSKLILF